MPARAYVYSGDWVAECPRPGCANVEFLHLLRYPDRKPGPGNPRDVRKAVYGCTNCLLVCGVDWPDESFKADVDTVLGMRPIPHTRNWYPEDHRIALAFGLPHGQTVTELLAENLDHGVAA